jgi:hypothetical protein
MNDVIKIFRGVNLSGTHCIKTDGPSKIYAKKLQQLNKPLWCNFAWIKTSDQFKTDCYLPVTDNPSLEPPPPPVDCQ